MAPKLYILIIGSGISSFVYTVGLTQRGHVVIVLEYSASL
jgi:hypothetical protein